MIRIGSTRAAAMRTCVQFWSCVAIATAPVQWSHTVPSKKCLAVKAADNPCETSVKQTLS
jgi:hypothetical protein